MRYARDMTPDPASDLADAEAVKDDEVLEREGLEEELMQQGRSEVGEEISDAETERKA
ncbi:MAG: hypothetical protein QOG43_1387 [Actinomycetota bacterium]|jgi:hypothetical protein|nr:hypothetical protein [Actinomycetota bacterium]